MTKALTVLFGTDDKAKRIKRGVIGGGVFILLSALGGGMSGGIQLFVPLTLFLFFGAVCAALTPMNILRTCGLGLILLGGTIVLVLTVDPMEKGQGFWLLGLGIATWWSVIKNFFRKNTSNPS